MQSCQALGLLRTCALSIGRSNSLSGLLMKYWSSGPSKATYSDADACSRRPARPACCHSEATVPGQRGTHEKVLSWELLSRPTLFCTQYSSTHGTCHRHHTATMVCTSTSNCRKNLRSLVACLTMLLGLKRGKNQRLHCCWGQGPERARTLEAQVQRDVQGSHIDAQLQRVGGGHRPQFAAEQRTLDLPPLLSAKLKRRGGKGGVVHQVKSTHGGTHESWIAYPLVMTTTTTNLEESATTCHRQIPIDPACWTSGPYQQLRHFTQSISKHHLEHNHFVKRSLPAAWLICV